MKNPHETNDMNFAVIELLILFDTRSLGLE